MRVYSPHTSKSISSALLFLFACGETEPTVFLDAQITMNSQATDAQQVDSDSGFMDEPDAGFPPSLDARVDASAMLDGGEPLDSGSFLDAESVLDAELALDAESLLDAGPTMDAFVPDAVVLIDVGTPDAQTFYDSALPDATVTDSGFIVDSGQISDSGILADSGTALYQRAVVGTGPPLAALSSSGRLEYRRYANQGQQNELNILPDYSYAGYQRGGVSIPDLQVQETLSPLTGDNRAQIQAAIDRVSQRTPDMNGFRGAVLLLAGNYEVSDTISIRSSGVVLRGEGQSTNGTILTATRRAQHNLIEIRGSGSGFGEISGTRVRITTPTVSVGINDFEVESGHTFNLGDTVIVLRTPNQHWIDTLGMGPYGWTPSSYAIGHERNVTRVAGRRIWVDIPIVDTIENAYGGGSVFKANIVGRIEKSGVEDLRLVSEYTGNEDEDHAWVGVQFTRAKNSWVRRVTVEHFGYAAVRISSESNFNSIEDTAMIDPISQISGGRRYPFVVNDGVGNLFQRCYAREGRHNFVTSSRVTGPNVWLDCLAVQSNSDDGPHHRWATGLLFDNTTGGPLNVQNRTTSGTGHGWAGAQTLFWNATASSMICDSPTGAMNWSIGSTGTRRQSQYSPAEPDCWVESHGTAVIPRSLYLQQLEDRLGAQAVEAVTLPAQRISAITSYLEQWEGESQLHELLRPDPNCSRGILSGQACCTSSCGTCGGTGCSQRPGGAANCCSNPINAAGRSCSFFPPPCVRP